MKVSTIVIAATSVVAAFIAASGTATSFARESEASYLSARDPRTITVVAQDYSFTAPEKVQAGPQGFSRAITLLAEGKNVNYEGVSGPMDYGANKVVRNRLARFKVMNGVFVDVTRYDCVADPVACPPIP